jgi:predicted TIM-barrel fold metal-dependent hydrolase
VPFVLEAVDYTFIEGGGLDDPGPFREMPSHYFADQVYACAFFEDLGRERLVEQVGAGNILFETDLPHPLCLYGQSVVDKLNQYLSRVDDATRERVTWSNAADLYRVGVPAEFAHVPDSFLAAEL